MIVPDFQNHVGKWMFSPLVNGKKVNTYSGRKWIDIKSRCGYTEEKPPKNKILVTYIGCVNNFSNFQVFVEWIRGQKGYAQQGWHLDKDLLVKGNKVYGPETCVLVPRDVNMALLKRGAKRGKYPIGVHWSKTANSFVAQVRNHVTEVSGVQAQLGTFDNPIDAFYAYKVAKEAYLKLLADRWIHQIDERAYKALYNYEVEITD